MLTPFQRRKVVIVDAEWVLLVFIMGVGLYQQVGWGNVYLDHVVRELWKKYQ